MTLYSSRFVALLHGSQLLEVQPLPPLLSPNPPM